MGYSTNYSGPSPVFAEFSNHFFLFGPKIRPKNKPNRGNSKNYRETTHYGFPWNDGIFTYIYHQHLHNNHSNHSCIGIIYRTHPMGIRHGNQHQLRRRYDDSSEDLPYEKLLGLSVLGASVTLQRLEIQEPIWKTRWTSWFLKMKRFFFFGIGRVRCWWDGSVASGEKNHRQDVWNPCKSREILTIINWWIAEALTVVGALTYP